jgi:MIP family channel proteins
LEVRLKLSTATLLRHCAAECIGTFGLVFAGCGAIIINDLTGGTVTHIGISITFGLAIATMVFATGHLSGGHINPAVTLALAMTRNFPWHKVPAYWSAQLLGALTAAMLLHWLFGNIASLGTTAPAGSSAQSLGLEMVLTFLLMFVIMAVATDSRAAGGVAALAIGAVIGLEATFAGPISGASMNPARSLGPAIISGNLGHLWIYLVGPISGASLGAFAYNMIRGDESGRTST